MNLKNIPIGQLGTPRSISDRGGGIWGTMQHVPQFFLKKKKLQVDFFISSCKNIKLILKSFDDKYSSFY